MAKEHPHAEAVYRFVHQDDQTYAVEVAIPGSFPTLVTSFSTLELAEAWVSGHKQRIAEARFRGPWRKNLRRAQPPVPA